MRKAAILLITVLLASFYGCSGSNTSLGEAAPSQAQTASATPAPAAKSATSPISPWSMKKDMPAARYELKAVALDGRMYVLGGSDGEKKLGIVEVYDPNTDSWSRIADIPVSGDCIGAAAAGGKIYAFVKDESSEKALVFEYDSGYDKWEKKSEMTSGRSNLGITVADGKIYVIGGLVGNDDNKDHPFTNVKTVEAFDPVTLQWTTKSDLIAAKHAMAVSTVNGKIYAIGGSITINNRDYPCKTVEEYNPITDQWSAKANMRVDSAYHCSAVINGSIYVTGGLLKSRLYIYDPTADKWVTKTNRDTASWQNAAAVLAGKLYVVGGTTGMTDMRMPLSSLESYDPATDVD